MPIDSLNGGSIYYDNINKHNENISISYRNAIGDDRNTIYENLKNGHTYMVHIPSQHWVTLAGLDANRDVVVVCANGHEPNRTYTTSIGGVLELNNPSLVFDVQVSRK